MTLRLVIAILGLPGLLGAAPAHAAWSAPETISLGSAGSGVSSLQFALTGGVAAATWNENSTTVRAAFRPFGGPFGSTATLDMETAVHEPSIAVGPGGQAVAAWGFMNSTGPVRAIDYADLTAGSTSFGSPVRLYTTGQSHDQGQTGTSIDSSGDTIVTWSGDDSCGNCGYSRIWSVTRAGGSATFPGSGAGAPAAVTGNFEVSGLESALNSAGQGVAYAWGFAQSPEAGISGERRAAGGTGAPWTSSNGYCCAIFNHEGPTSIAVDPAGNAYITVDVAGSDGGLGVNSDPGPKFVYVKNDGSVPEAPQNPDTGFFGTASAPASDPQITVDASGNAVMTWIRTDPGPSYDLFMAYRPAGDTTTFGVPQLVVTGLPNANEPASNSQYRIATDSQGDVVLIWDQGCTGSVCTLQSEVRPPGATSTFGSPQTIASNVMQSAPVELVADSAGNVLAGWRDNVTGMVEASLLQPANTAVPTISGTPSPGHALTCSSGSWSWFSGAFGYAWKRDSAAIPGASSQTHAPAAADVGHQLTCTVTASNSGGSASAASAPVTISAPPPASGHGGGSVGPAFTSAAVALDGGERLLTLLAPARCVAPPDGVALLVQLSSTRKFSRRQAQSRIVRVEFFIDGGIRSRHRTHRHVSIQVKPNAIATRAPFAALLATTRLASGVHHVRVLVVLRKTVARHGHLRTRTFTRTLTATLTIC
jgi:hypothetical protein